MKANEMTSETNSIIVALTKPATTIGAATGGLVAGIGSWLGIVNLCLGFVSVVIAIVVGCISLYLKIKEVKKSRSEDA